MWLFLALGASIVWGLSYALNGQLFKHISVYTFLFFFSIVSALVTGIISFFSGRLKTDTGIILGTPQILFLTVAAIATFIVAELCINLSINAKNATLAGIIEVIYPLFIALFSYILFKETHLSLMILVGGVLIMAGVFIVALNAH